MRKSKATSKRGRAATAALVFAPAAATVALLLAASSIPPTAAGSLAPRGVAPQDVAKYAPKLGTTDRWQCLTTGEEIPHVAINDDYCDCADGSDEPGTSACNNARFYCANEGHIPAYILSSRVNDGICDPECCDGSDEYDAKVQCPDTCGKMGKEYRNHMAQQENTRRAGAKIRAKYISDAKKKVSALQADAAKLTDALARARDAEAKSKAALEYAENADKETTARKKAMPLYGTLTQFQSALHALSTRNSELTQELEQLTNLLDDLAKGYNPNYQDMAVKGAVMAYASWRRDNAGGGAPDAAGDEAPSEGHAGGLADEPAARLERLKNPGEWPVDKVFELADQDVLELMDGIDSGEKAGHDAGLLFRIHEYLPDSVVPYFEAFVDTLLDLLLKANIISSVKRVRPAGASADIVPENVSRAREAYNKDTSEVRRLESELATKQAGVGLSPEKFGREGEFKSLEGTCVERPIAEYVYEFCFGGRATQKPRNGAHVSLGSFNRFNPENNSSPDQDEYYSTAIYDNGQRCWNGPDRSVFVNLVCDTKNGLLDVFEAEKCIYSMTVSTPAICFPPAAEAADPAKAGAGDAQAAKPHRDEL
ncbi:hypothetical protein K437DRAFT_260198 [Tilletiaria anomala UBC 951]|uniref:Glucosidase 2 subunit beta n=1 Tax=Tilletiaria anomala (strain ATCC 24038 / CBS 436.72 / UBC 951) TaxID=1037660 RepID=A0A066V7D2_TILAU|nr:uncharacterized protein K437DRAFT_260198 [Tilletiaria anomala UBC 951]KDN36198.1 hypothetical protein K437DRAFT_260198 [Tilletiaria anomala UBC 951]